MSSKTLSSRRASNPRTSRGMMIAMAIIQGAVLTAGSGQAGREREREMYSIYVCKVVHIEV